MKKYNVRVIDTVILSDLLNMTTEGLIKAKADKI